MGRRVTGVAVALLSAALVTEAYSLDAAATVVDLDEFAVVRNGTTIFDDSFNRNTTLSGGSGTVLPSGTTFSDGTAANYRVQGSIPETTISTRSEPERSVIQRRAFSVRARSRHVWQKNRPPLAAPSCRSIDLFPTSRSLFSVRRRLGREPSLFGLHLKSEPRPPNAERQY